MLHRSFQSVLQIRLIQGNGAERDEGEEKRFLLTPRKMDILIAGTPFEIVFVTVLASEGHY